MGLRARYLYFVEVTTPGSVAYRQRVMRDTRDQARGYKRALKGCGVESVIYRSTVGSGESLRRIR